MMVPIRWKVDPQFVWYKCLQQSKISQPLECNHLDADEISFEHARVQESLLLMKFYSLSSGIANQLLTARDGSEIDLPFEMNQEELKIVQFPRSSFILGRSGTGKTTVLTTRLLQKEHQSYIASHGFSHQEKNEFQEVERRKKEDEILYDIENRNTLRQLFITVSAKLCSAIRNHIGRIHRYDVEC
eukprot:Gb_27383 [translate_table: standard]